MNTVGINSQTASSLTTEREKNAVMQKDDFLRLLVTQMKHQDPLNPMENSEYAAQLAQFSSLESLENLNKSAETQILLGQSMNNSFLTSLIGKEVKAYGNGVKFDGDNAEITYYLEKTAGVSVDIYDKNGNLVKTINANTQNAGNQSVNWDGTDKNGNKVAAGDYTFKVKALDGTDEVTAHAFTEGMVSGIAYEQGSPYLKVNGSYVNLGDVIELGS